MTIPKVSIVVPVFWVKKEYLKNCIQSLQKQTLQEIEILIVCDGAAENIVTYCKKIADTDARITVLEQENQGVAVARNNGIRNARAPYITFVDVDDWVEPQFCEFFLETFEEHPEVQIVSSAAFINRDGTERKNPFWPGAQKIFRGNEKEELELQAIFKEAASFTPTFATFGTTWAKAYRTEWLKDRQLFYEPALRRGQDTVFNLYAFEKADAVLYQENYLYHYRMNSESTVHRYTDHTIDILERISTHILKFIRTYNKGERFYQAYNNKSIQLLSQSMNSDYLHRDNPKPYKVKRKELKKVLSKPCYRESFKNIDMDLIPKQRKIYWLLMKFKMVDVIFLLNRILG